MADALIVLLIWTRPLTPRRLVLLCGLFGLIAGVGVGFRPDVVLWFPMLATALLFGPHASLRRRLTATALALAVSVGALGVFGWPMLTRYSSGSNFGHVALLGFAHEFDDRLGVRSGPYTITPFYNDAYMYAAIASYAKHQGHAGELRLLTADYERYAMTYYRDVTRTFSADVAIRFVASVFHVLNLPFERQEYANDSTLEGLGVLGGILQARRTILGALDGTGPNLVLLVLLLFAARGAALAWGFAMTVLYLAGLPMLQFHLRHYSQLELIGLFALGVVVQTAARSVTASGRGRLQEPWTWPSLRPGVVRVGACLALVVLVPLILIHVLRWRQQSVLSRLVASYDLAAAEEMPYSIRSEDPDRVMVVPAGVTRAQGPRRPGRQVYGEYLVVDVGDGCDAMSLTIRVVFDASAGSARFSRDLPVTLWPRREYGSARLYLPIYQFVDGNNVPDLGFRFTGLELLTRDLPCLTGVRRVPDGTGPPLWLDLRLARNWKDRPLYQTLADPAIVDVHETAIYKSSPGLPLRSRWMDTVTHVPPGLAPVSKIATVDPSRGVVVNGIAGSFAYLAVGRPVGVTAGSQLVAVGELFSGGLTVGLLRNDAWSQTINVTTPGRFVAAVDASADGTYVAVIANVNPDPARPTRFVITGVDWAAPPAPPARAR
jgi:hypothetical protein